MGNWGLYLKIKFFFIGSFGSGGDKELGGNLLFWNIRGIMIGGQMRIWGELRSWGSTQGGDSGMGKIRVRGSTTCRIRDEDFDERWSTT